MAQEFSQRTLTHKSRVPFQRCGCGIYGDKEAVRLVSSRVLWFYPIDTIPPIFRTLSVIRLQHHQKVILAVACLSNT